MKDPKMIDNEAELISIAGTRPLLCRLFGHRWWTFDHDWCGRDTQMCRRFSLYPFGICGAVRSINTPEQAHD